VEDTEGAGEACSEGEGERDIKGKGPGKGTKETTPFLDAGPGTVNSESSLPEALSEFLSDICRFNVSMDVLSEVPSMVKLRPLRMELTVKTRGRKGVSVW
jgi:hypothetical protein